MADPNCDGWTKYRSIKEVRAKEIASLSGEGSDQLIVFVDGTTMAPVPNMFARNSPAPGDFIVRYEDGYISWSPRQPFVTGYVKS